MQRSHLLYYAMERGTFVPESVLARGELTEVLRGLGHDIVVELEDDAAGGGAVDGDIELQACSEALWQDMWLGSCHNSHHASVCFVQRTCYPLPT